MMSNFGLFQAHPGKVALEIIVGQQRVRAQAQKFRESRIVGKRGGVAQRLDGGIKPLAVRDVIGNRFERSALAANDGPRIVQRRLLTRMRRDVAVEFLMRQVGRIKRPARRPRRGAHKRRIVIDQVEAAAVDSQKSAQFQSARRGASGQLVIKLQAFRIALPPVNGFQELAGFHKFRDHLPLARRQVRGVVRHSHRLEFGDFRPQIGRDHQFGNVKLGRGFCP